MLVDGLHPHQVSALVANDARAEGRNDIADEIMADDGPEVAWVRCTRQRRHPRPYFDPEGWDYDEDDERAADPTFADQRRDYNRQWRAIDWLAWPADIANVLEDL